MRLAQRRHQRRLDSLGLNPDSECLSGIPVPSAGSEQLLLDPLRRLPSPMRSLPLRSAALMVFAIILGLSTLTSGCSDFSVPGTTVQFDYEGQDPQPGQIRCIDDRDCGVRQICIRSFCTIGCRSSSDCPSGEICGGDPAQCVNALECSGDEGCGGEAPACHPTLSFCTRCQQADDCPDNEVCLVDPQCLAGLRTCTRDDYSCGLCTSGAQCPSGVCNTDSGRCVDCVTDAQCPTGQVCDVEAGTCTQCVDRSDCTEPLPACLRTETGGQCVLCASDADCPDGTCNRDTLSCQGCLSDEDCQGDNLLCNPVSGLCFDRNCAFREEPDLLEINIEATIDAPFVAGPPVAASVRDDDGDGVPGPLDNAEIAIPMSPPLEAQDALAIWSADGQRRIWTTTSALGAVRSLALGDIDADGRTETVALRDGRLVAFNATGSPLWTSGSRTDHIPGLFDVDADGFAEVVAGGSLFSEVGQRIWVGQEHQGGHLGLGLPGVGLAAQLDGEGPLEIIAGGTIYSAQGQTLCSQGLDGYNALANIQGDERPELIVASVDGSIRALDADCQVIWGPVIPGDPGQGAGPPAVADLDGDGAVEIVYVARQDTLVALGGDGQIRWETPLSGASVATAVSVVDLQGNGESEVLVADAEGLKVVRGGDGFVLTTVEQGASTLPLAAPMVLDVDADGALEIVVTTGSGDIDSKVLVLGDVRDRWVDAPNRWNQVAYFVQNAQDNLRAPPFLGPWWLEGDNRFRSQPTTISTTPAPNLVLRRVPGAVDLSECPDRYTIGVGIYNRGILQVPPGVTLSAERLDQRPLLEATTTELLIPGDEEILVLTFDNLAGPVDVQMTVARPDEDEALVPECRLEDNVLIFDGIGCPGLP